MAAVPDRTQATLDRLSEQGFAYYNERLKSLLEPEQNGRVVAIHLASGDYAVAANSPSAMRALRDKQPEGMIMTMVIGPERDDPTLDRMLARQTVGAQK